MKQVRRLPTVPGTANQIKAQAEMAELIQQIITQPGRMSSDFAELLELSFCSSLDKPNATAPIEMPPFTRVARLFGNRVYEVIEEKKGRICHLG